ncbi:helix-turn-helix domain-containing protein [Gordonibacter massiliensis (ex Traore et al. 2017)]|uniref:helix-turn-helix domain-containing protein n=1 Tax=Gordonibacter massiliensis (ex Traore et al. 2017) TaxID=1841863 RepID=UPI001C8B2B35|nr:helix-turn-helix transcriptional regulator [Gordonibacter massiliensis (ex Traore et al. 2017)]MBX9034501.1 helix-turn-helix transcriptional regulator [Gordonibacter massiliensis (ex Traore et al. 2017)]
MAIVIRLDRMLADRKMSLNALAEAVDMTNVNLSNLKTGKMKGIRFATMNAICRALDCQPGDLFEYVDDEEDSD